MEHTHIWTRIVSVHLRTKRLMLLAEELDGNFQTYFHPIKEHRDTLEHIIRAKSVTLEMRQSQDESYIEMNLQKALGHEYRAFFDVADWLAVNIRETIQRLLTPYPNAAIAAVCPRYYGETRPKLELVTQKIAEIRASKDIANEVGIISQVEEYDKQIEWLLETCTEMQTWILALEEWKQKDQKRRGWSVARKIAIGILIAGASWAIGRGCKKSSEPPAIPKQQPTLTQPTAPIIRP